MRLGRSLLIVVDIAAAVVGNRRVKREASLIGIRLWLVAAAVRLGRSNNDQNLLALRVEEFVTLLAVLRQSQHRLDSVFDRDALDVGYDGDATIGRDRADRSI